MMMTGGREETNEEKEERLFEVACKIEDTAARRAYLEEACADDLELRGRMESILGVVDSGVDYLGKAAFNLSASALTAEYPRELAGTQIGAYTLRETLGEGGFGRVWRADQREPVRRQVALKIVKLGMNSEHVMARFELERQALALMDHPGIARVHDAGMTEDGRPFFVMELVDGRPITSFCRERGEGVRARLELFIKVCRAVHHAHQKGVIHRDIKPSNVLVSWVDEQALPKVIDFGIAKASEGGLTDRTHLTQFSQFLGTPAYMSPEQVEMGRLDIDTRADVYGLGVILYELLLGETPFDGQVLLDSGFDTMRETIRNQEPARLSDRLRAIERGGDSGWMSELGPDLDWIVMKCLEKERQRRYESASALAEDVERYLVNEPIIARPPTRTYRLYKTWQRNRFAYCLALGVTTSLIVGLGVAVFFWLKERDSRVRIESVEQEQRRLRTVADTTAFEANQSDYVSSVRLAYQQLREGNHAWGEANLRKWVPSEGDIDHRDFCWRYLVNEYQKSSPVIFSGEKSLVLEVAFHPDGRTLAGARRDGMVLLWDLESATERFRWKAHDRYFVALDYSRDGDWMATLGEDEDPDDGGSKKTRIKIWRLSSGEEVSLVREIEAHGAKFKSRGYETSNVIFSPTDDVLAYPGIQESGAPEGDDITLYHYPSDRVLRVLPGAGSVFGFSPDGTQLVTGATRGDKSDVMVWEVESGELRSSLGDIADFGVVFDRTADQLLSPRGRSVEVWDWNGEQRRLGWEAGNDFVTGLAQSPSGDLVAVADYGTLRLLGWPGAMEIQSASAFGYAIHDLEFSGDGRHLAYTAREKVVVMKVGDEETAKLGSTRLGPFPSAPVFSPDGRLMVCRESSDLVIRDWKANQELARVTDSGIPLALVQDRTVVILIRYQADKKRPDRGKGPIEIVDWEWQHDQLVERGTLGTTDTKIVRRESLLVGETAVSLVLDEPDGELSFWNVATMEPQDRDLRVRNWLGASSRSGEVIAVPHPENRGEWSFVRADGEEILGQVELPYPVRFVRFGGDRRAVIIPPVLPTYVDIIDLEADAPLRRLNLPVARDYIGDVSPDGEVLALSGTGLVIELYHLDTGRLELSLPVSREIADLAFSEDGRFLLARSHARYTSKPNESEVFVFEAPPVTELTRAWAERDREQ